MLKRSTVIIFFFRWPVAYFGSSTGHAHQLYNIFWKCVDVMDEIGFTVDYVMYDGASSNRSFTNMLFESSPREKNIFTDVYDIQYVPFKI